MPSCLRPYSNSNEYVSESAQATTPQPSPVEVSKISEEEADNAANEAAGENFDPI